jgi:hypothetical protein
VFECERRAIKMQIIAAAIIIIMWDVKSSMGARSWQGKRETSLAGPAPIYVKLCPSQ